MDRKKHRTSPYPAEFRERAVQMVVDHLDSYRSLTAAVSDIARKLGCSSDSLRVWYSRAQRDAGKEAGPTSAETARIKELEREVRELRQANEILKKGEPMERQWSERHWRTPICSVLPIAPSTCHERKAIASEPARASRRAQRDAVLREQISKLWSGNRGVYGARKIWHALRRDGVTAARCTVERLRREMGLKGVVRGRKVVTTNPDAARPCPDDKVNRAFHAARPNQLWVSDFTCVPTWSGTVYVAFVIDVFAREPSGPCIARNSPPGCFVRASPDHSASIGWRVSTSMTTQFVLDALEQALWQRKPHGNNSLIHHSDRGSQYLSITYTERLADADIDPSVGTVGDSYDNALAECVIGLFKTEVIKQLGPWKSMQDVEWETMHRVDWYNENRLLSSIGYVPPAEAERRHLERTDPVDKVA